MPIIQLELKMDTNVKALNKIIEIA